MIDRGTMLRGFFALLLVAVVCSVAYSFLSNTEGSSGNFLEDDDRGYAYGPIFEDPDGYRQHLLADRWVRDIKLSDGGTFGTTITKQVRIGIDGSGPIPGREVTLETRPTVELFDGQRRDRAEDVLHGLQRILEERGGLLEGISLTTSQDGMEAATVAAIVEMRVAEGFESKSDRAIVSRIIQEEARSEAADLYAWYRGQFQQVVLGPKVSAPILRWIRTPKKVTAADGIFAASILRHELEHAVTPAGNSDYETMRWLEEGTAETIERWPGAAATTAKELGLPYPKRFEDAEYRSPGGYPEYTDTLRILLKAAGVDWTDAQQLDAAYELLQEPEIRDVPRVLAERIAKRDRLPAAERLRLERSIRALDGDPAAARRLVASL